MHGIGTHANHTDALAVYRCLPTRKVDTGDEGM